MHILREEQKTPLAPLGPFRPCTFACRRPVHGGGGGRYSLTAPGKSKPMPPRQAWAVLIATALCYSSPSLAREELVPPGGLQVLHHPPYSSGTPTLCRTRRQWREWWGGGGGRERREKQGIKKNCKKARGQGWGEGSKMKPRGRRKGSLGEKRKQRGGGEKRKADKGHHQPDLRPALARRLCAEQESCSRLSGVSRLSSPNSLSVFLSSSQFLSIPIADFRLLYHTSKPRGLP